jgi:hypothetical protein
MAAVEVIQIKGDATEAINALKQVGIEAQKTQKKAEDSNQAINDGLTALDKRTGGAVSAFKSLQGGLKSAISGFKTLRGAIAATGLGLLLIAITSLTAAFKSSEVINRFTGMLELIPSIGKAIGLLFKGEFAAAGKTAADAVGKVVLGVESITDSVGNAIEAVKEFGAEQVREGKLAAQVSDMRAKAAKIERDLLVERSVKEAEIAALRLKSRQEEEFGAEERRQAILDAQKLEDELLQKEVKALELKAEAQTLENTFSRSNIENLNKEAVAIAAVNNIQSQRLTQQRATQRELNRLNKEIAAEDKARLDEQKTAEAAYRAEQDKLANEAYLLLLSDQEREVQAVIEKYIKLTALDNLNAEQRAALTEKQEAEIAAIEARPREGRTGQQKRRNQCYD